jgi:hypothetical protein
MKSVFLILLVSFTLLFTCNVFSQTQVIDDSVLRILNEYAQPQADIHDADALTILFGDGTKEGVIQDMIKNKLPLLDDLKKGFILNIIRNVLINIETDLQLGHLHVDKNGFAFNAYQELHDELITRNGFDKNYLALLSRSIRIAHADNALKDNPVDLLALYYSSKTSIETGKKIEHAYDNGFELKITTNYDVNGSKMGVETRCYYNDKIRFEEYRGPTDYLIFYSRYNYLPDGSYSLLTKRHPDMFSTGTISYYDVNGKLKEASVLELVFLNNALAKAETYKDLLELQVTVEQIRSGKISAVNITNAGKLEEFYTRLEARISQIENNMDVKIYLKDVTYPLLAYVGESSSTDNKALIYSVINKMAFDMKSNQGVLPAGALTYLARGDVLDFMLVNTISDVQVFKVISSFKDLLGIGTNKENTKYDVDYYKKPEFEKFRTELYNLKMLKK